ncbi:hypothetical protein B0H10DRAFT_2250129 [Mycena sp. CBHHK59/15]|nr:hypothetical protein B0H10DRAFT_2250129 [Mycena sp. CBHHK59/15]
MAHDTFQPKKKRSSGHKEQLERARAGKTASAHDASADKENVDPAPLYRKIDKLEGKVADVESQLQEEKAKTAEARARCQNTRRREVRVQEANVMLQAHMKSSEAFKDDLLAAQLALEKYRQEASVLLTRNSALVKQAKASSMRIRRAPTMQARAVEKVRAASHLFRLQQKGIITEASRELVTDLVSLHNVPVSRVLSVIRAVAATVGVQVDGDISERSVGRIVLEGASFSKRRLFMKFSRRQISQSVGMEQAYTIFSRNLDLSISRLRCIPKATLPSVSTVSLGFPRRSTIPRRRRYKAGRM